MSWREIVARPYTIFKAEPEMEGFCRNLEGALLVPSIRKGEQLLTKKEVAYFTKEEIKDFLLKGILPEESLIGERIKHYLFIRRPGLTKIVSNRKHISQIISKELKSEKVKWHKLFTREIHPFDWEAGILAYSENFGGKINIGLKNQLYLPEDGKHGFYYGSQDYQNFKNFILRKSKNNPLYLEKESRLCREACKDMVKASRKLSFALGRKAKKNLLEPYQDYLGRFKRYCFYLEMIPAIEDFLEKTVKDLLKEALKDEPEKKFNTYLSIISTKIKRVAAEEEEIDKLKLAIELRKGKNIERKLGQHLRKYAWLPFYGLETEPLKKEDILKEIREIKNPEQQLERRLREINIQERKFKKTKKELIRWGNENLLMWTQILQEYLYLRTYRTDAYRRMLFFFKPFIEYLAEKIGWKYYDIIYFRPQEVINYLRNQKLPSIREIKSRQKQWAIVVKSGRLEFITNKKQIQQIKDREFGKTKKGVGDLMGRVAQKGKVKGQVKIIRTRKDWEKMKEGNILVTHMTTPEMIMVIKKAGAIVTDEGGITCHAAIVSREFGIPCVVGTQIATKVLKDGDWVEVDAERGVVKRLQKFNSG